MTTKINRQAAKIEKIMEVMNCREADIDASGDIWIADPQAGHWLNADQRADVERRIALLTTDDEIRALRSEAAQAGDLAQVEVCTRALHGDQEAIIECARVIANAQAMQD